MTAERTAATPDVTYMAQALALAERGLYTTDPNPRVGCVLTRDGQVIGEGWHERAGESHAEVRALGSVGGEARGATAYVTLEPCSHVGRTPPCADALIAAGIARVVCAVSDPHPKVAGRGIRRLQAAGIDVTVGTLAPQARALNAGFFSRFERRRAFIRLKLAMSLDARTTPAAGGQAWITGAAARADVQTWRARSSAVLTGAGTVRVDDPRLDVRLAYGPWIRQPLRVVLDPELSCASTARVFDGDNAVIFAASTADPARAAADVARIASGMQGEGGTPAVNEAAAVSGTQAATGTAAMSGTQAVTGTAAMSGTQAVTGTLATSGTDAAGRTHGASGIQRVSDASQIPELLDGRISVTRVPRAGRGLDLSSVVERLNALEVNELLIECGPRLAAAFLEADLVDELILYVAPTFLGADAAPLAALHGLTGASSVRSFEFREQRLIGGDLRLILTPRRD